MTTQLCECDSRDCRETIHATIETLQFVRSRGDIIIISKTCKVGPSLGDELIDEGEDFLVYSGRD